MSKPDDGGHAFPMPYSTDEHVNPCNATFAEYGMSLRAFAAVHIIAAMHARSDYDEGLATPEQRANVAVIEADALIAALAERNKQ